MSQLLTQIETDLLQAQKSQDEVKVSTLRYLLAQIKNAQIEKGRRESLEDSEIEAEIAKEVKKHKESIESFEKAGRGDLEEREKAELAILQSYQPAQLSAEEITKIVDEVLGQIGNATQKDFGKVMSSAMGKLTGKADGAVVAGIVRNKLAKL